MTQEFSQQIFEEFSNIKFHENPSGRSRVVPCRHDEANSRFSQFCERTKKTAAIAKLYKGTQDDLIYGLKYVEIQMQLPLSSLINSGSISMKLGTEYLGMSMLFKYAIKSFLKNLAWCGMP